MAKVAGSLQRRDHVQRYLSHDGAAVPILNGRQSPRHRSGTISGLKDSRPCAECAQAGFATNFSQPLIRPNQSTSPPCLAGLGACRPRTSRVGPLLRFSLKFLPSRSSTVHTPVVLCPGAQKKKRHGQCKTLPRSVGRMPSLDETSAERDRGKGP